MQLVRIQVCLSSDDLISFYDPPATQVHISKSVPPTPTRGVSQIAYRKGGLQVHCFKDASARNVANRLRNPFGPGAASQQALLTLTKIKGNTSQATNVPWDCNELHCQYFHGLNAKYGEFIDQTSAISLESHCPSPAFVESPVQETRKIYNQNRECSFIINPSEQPCTTEVVLAQPIQETWYTRTWVCLHIDIRIVRDYIETGYLATAEDLCSIIDRCVFQSAVHFSRSKSPHTRLTNKATFGVMSYRVELCSILWFGQPPIQREVSCEGTALYY